MKKWLDNCFICGLKLKYLLKFNSPLCVCSSLLKCTWNDRNQQVAISPPPPQRKHNLEIETEKQWERVQREGEIPWPWPTSQRTGGAFFGPWKVWLSSGFPEPGKFPQWRSMAPLSARNAGPQRETQYRLCQIPRLGLRGKAGGLGVKNQLFNVCYKYFRETHT